MTVIPAAICHTIDTVLQNQAHRSAKPAEHAVHVVSPAALLPCPDLTRNFMSNVCWGIAPTPPWLCI